MKGFNFEKNLTHQTQAVQSTVQVFANAIVEPPKGTEKHCINPLLNNSSTFWYSDGISKVQADNGITEAKLGTSVKHANSPVLDIMMETGTGKTYTYTKTLFELNKLYGIHKFIVVVPTLSIKAGTINFLKSASSREHFKEAYGKTINLHIVESQKSTKNKKTRMPPAVQSFVNSGAFDKTHIQVLIINQGMINSPAMQASFDTGLFDKYTVPFDAISAVQPIMIIDEPHKFAHANKTWQNLEKMHPQYILRYGATFPEKELKRKNHTTGKLEKYSVKDYHNLVYTLTAVDSFNRNLVKGVVGHVTEFEQGKNALLKFVNSDGKEASFELTQGSGASLKKTTVKLAKKDSLAKAHSVMTDLTIENLNKTTVVLSNGLELKKGDKINPFSYAQTLQEIMLQKAVKHHFKLEKDLLTRGVKIKPLTLFFIDNIEEYRGDDGYLKTTLETLIKAEVTNLLKTLVDSEDTAFYREYLQKTLTELSLTHGGYFAVDNKNRDSNKEDDISKQIDEILYNKQAMLDLNNPRRFIFSKWTLREGWDNPNVFQICKLRSSGSDISKLQEVGRGLRLPVNEYGNRVKDEQFYLNYFVDFTETDFIDTLVSEINSKSGAVSADNPPEKLDNTTITNICQAYGITEEDLLDTLDDNNAINRSNNFKDGGWAFIVQNYPLAFEGVGANKIRKATDTKQKISIRKEKYSELQALWEKLNEKVLLEYSIANEAEFQVLLTDFFSQQADGFSAANITNKVTNVEIIDDQAYASTQAQSAQDTLTPMATLSYSDFLKRLSSVLFVNMNTLHKALSTAVTANHLNINDYLNSASIRQINQNFKDYLLYSAIDKYSISYKKVSNCMHPTKLTDKRGKVVDEVNASDVGVLYGENKVADGYLFDELYYDSELERQNIITNIQEVVVFTKIPKNSIKIPVAGGRSYSPDFAYVLHMKDGAKKLNFIVETKGKNNKEILDKEEAQKIRHAEKLFGNDVSIQFKTQLNNHKMLDLIGELLH